MTNLDSILKSRDITLLIKVHTVKAMVFPVVMYGCKSWTIKKAECQRTDTFELRCWRRLLRVPWTARKSNQTILKEISPVLNIHWKDWSWSWSSNTLATWCKELTHWKRLWCWERLRQRFCPSEMYNKGKYLLSIPSMPHAVLSTCDYLTTLTTTPCGRCLELPHMLKKAQKG